MMNIDQRKFEVLFQSNNFRLTLAKDRVTIKIPLKASLDEAEQWSEWCRKVADMDFARGVEVTLRGRCDELDPRDLSGKQCSIGFYEQHRLKTKVSSPGMGKEPVVIERQGVDTLAREGVI